jgi:sec-independent protein translocase protein TatA
MFGGTFGTQELILILILVLVLFGAKRIPEIMRGFGQGLKEFKDASQRAMDEIDEATSVEPPPKKRSTQAKAATGEDTEDREKVEATAAGED